MAFKRYPFFFILLCCHILSSVETSGVNKCSEASNITGNLSTCLNLRRDILSPISVIATGISDIYKGVVSNVNFSRNKNHYDETNISLSNQNNVFNNSLTATNKTRLYYCHVDNNNSNHSRAKRYVLQGGKWKKLELTWAVITPSSKSSVMSVVVQEFTKALGVWSKHSKLKFHRVNGNAKEIDIKVGFHVLEHGDKYTFDGKGNTLAHAFYPGGSDLSGDVHFDDAEDFTSHSDASSTSSGTSLFITAAHELGHSLGLRHSNEENSLMAPYYKPHDGNFELPHDDQMAIQSLYGRPEVALPRLRPKPPQRTRPPIVHTTKRPVIRPTPQTPKATRPTSRPIHPPDIPIHSTQWPMVPPSVSTKSPYWPTDPPYWPTEIPHLPTTYWPYFPPVGPHQPMYQCSLAAPSEIGKPDLCSGEFDAISKFGQEVYFFKDKYVWRVDYSQDHREFHQYRIDSMFHELRAFNITKIDAAYSKQNDEGLVLIVGQRLFVIGMDADKTSHDATLTGIGINASHIDAAWTWGHNGHVYLLSGDDYWRLGKDGKAQVDYPRDSAVWRGLPPNISAAFTYSGITYFFSRNVFWSFDNRLMWAKTPALEVASFWFGCPHYDTRERKICSDAPRIKPFSIFIFMILIFEILL